ncbi:MAG: phosphoribosylformylglycinamidine synthase subunit PurS [Bryobacterales bacterium]|nr:phosphoribosylformylglycinamidine synthase subunit PurS [Bryobacterales bacterium]
MKALVHVKLKPTVLDPQGQTIQRALAGMGHSEISSVRQGKYFEIDLDASVSRDAALKNLTKVAQDVLTNPVIEEFSVEILG